MTQKNDMSRKLVDPDVLGIIGAIQTLVGLAEMVSPARFRVARRHRKVDRLLDRFKAHLDDGRTALRSLRSVVEEAKIQSDAIAFSVQDTEFAIYRRALEELQEAMAKLTKVSHELEATLSEVGTEAERFYKISKAGRPVLKAVSDFLESRFDVSRSDLSTISLPDLLRQADQFLASCSSHLDQRDDWLRGTDESDK